MCAERRSQPGLKLPQGLQGGSEIRYQPLPSLSRYLLHLLGKCPCSDSQAATSEVGWGMGGLEGLLRTGLQCLVLCADWHVGAERDWLRIRG